MTKAQEKAILEQIKALIESTGKDSYISAAFAGCIELAHENIDNDFMFSYPEKLEMAYKDAQTAKQEAQTHKATADALKSEIDALKADNKRKADTIDRLISEARQEQAERDELEKDIDILKAALTGSTAEKDREITELKAKLYDFMIERS